MYDVSSRYATPAEDARSTRRRTTDAHINTSLKSRGGSRASCRLQEARSLRLSIVRRVGCPRLSAASRRGRRKLALISGSIRARTVCPPPAKLALISGSIRARRGGAGGAAGRRRSADASSRSSTRRPADEGEVRADSRAVRHVTRHAAMSFLHPLYNINNQRTSLFPDPD